MEYSPEFLDGLRDRFAHTADPDKEMIVHGGAPGSRNHRFETDTLLEVLAFCGDFTGKRVLEFGCGTGSITPVLAARAKEVVAFDIDADSVALCRQRIDEHGLTNVTIICDDAFVPPRPGDEAFDLVIMHAVMEHVPLSIPGLRASVLRSAMESVAPGGHLFIYETPNRSWPKDIHTTSLWLIPWTKPGSRWAYNRAVKAGKHRPRSADETTIALEERGAWGLSYREIARYLDEGTYDVVNLQPGHDRWVRHHRSLGRGRRAYETMAYYGLTKPFRIPVVAVTPMLSPLVLQRPSNGTTVATIVVTHNRLDVLTLTLDSLVAQTVAPAKIFVVDSGSTECDPRELLATFPDIEVIRVGDNVGYGAALSIGIDAARDELAPDYYWLLDDDSPVEPDALDQVLALALRSPRTGIIGNRGGRLRAGLPRWFGSVTSRPRDADFCTVDGALLSRAAVETCGTPRRDFFMMHEDLEYTTRVAASGLRVIVADAVGSAPMHLGSRGAAPLYWRDYYQSRNHLRFVLDRRSIIGVLGWAVRETVIVLAGLRRGRPGLVKARLVAQGARDAVRHRMGRTVEPGSI